MNYDEAIENEKKSFFRTNTYLIKSENESVLIGPQQKVLSLIKETIYMC